MSDSLPDWLPDLIDTDGAWQDILDRLYAVFEADFKVGRPSFRGLPIWWDRKLSEGDTHEDGFWHLVTMDDPATGDRLLDTFRAKRLAWCRAIIDNHADPLVLVWDYLEGSGKVRTYLWLENSDYVVILEKTKRKGKDVAFSLVTAFHLGGESRRKAMRRKYDNRVP
jgi:hypothetical protein